MGKTAIFVLSTLQQIEPVADQMASPARSNPGAFSPEPEGCSILDSRELIPKGTRKPPLSTSTGHGTANTNIATVKVSPRKADKIIKDSQIQGLLATGNYISHKSLRWNSVVGIQRLPFEAGASSRYCRFKI
ncbi:hypothetical protein CKAN_00189800 [Cinnamomum micranthum f. kanehirae]|uniref:Uncharacterized protein n=1 Tax=Cinnamomum micranthum f. kanehirae TaxID=337451 RepID=A0A3S3NR92_9MAGN|nr:hypothetical protein CKAN_00189800 [Cinnamomum micranthum f. kanehirae]